MRQFLHAKIHKAVITQADLSYVGSITIDSNLLELAGIEECERVLVVSNTTGARLETYALRGEPGSGIVCMNGAAAHLVQVGHEVIIMAFEYVEKASPPNQILVDANNQYVRHIDPDHGNIPAHQTARARTGVQPLG
ncbi:MAG: aspartate 1-decarboxylase [Planctomycetota bacterium]|nr:aspartate 1-decarboxylase [Planctomycetota bacterium]